MSPVTNKNKPNDIYVRNGVKYAKMRRVPAAYGHRLEWRNLQVEHNTNDDGNWRAYRHGRGWAVACCATLTQLRCALAAWADWQQRYCQ